MNIPRYWARSAPGPAGSGVRPVPGWCWRWSDVSVDDAQRSANERVIELARMLEAGTPLDRYAYGDRPLREEIVQVVAENLAVVTRNLYGALVLNSSRCMFIDVDFADKGAVPKSGLFRRLLGKSAAAGPEEGALQSIRECAGRRPDLGMRIYRTRAGLRGLVTNRTFDPAAPESIDLLNDIGSDPLYIRLCQAQACFRARLTPKPWRCGLRPPATRYPLLTADAQQRFNRWRAEYERVILGFGVCQFVEHVGRADVHPEVRQMLALHDQFACARSDRPLA